MTLSRELHATELKAVWTTHHPAAPHATVIHGEGKEGGKEGWRNGFEARKKGTQTDRKQLKSQDEQKKVTDGHRGKQRKSASLLLFI